MEDINVFGDINFRIWERQKLYQHSNNYKFNYKNFAKDATWAVHVGNAKVKFNPKPNSKNIFMIVEPPEIYHYPLEDLMRFEIIAGPSFQAYRDLPNYLFSQVALPWSVGISYPEIPRHLKSRTIRKILSYKLITLRDSPKINFDVHELLKFNLPKEKFLSIVTSNKVHTPMQKNRLEFIRFLISRNTIPIEVYGRGFKSINDKFEILSRSSHHLALENSSYDGYWTEKLADPILSLNRTYYSGAPDVNKYFPPDSVLSIDLSDFEKAATLIEEDFMNSSFESENLESARLTLICENSFENIVSNVIQTYEKKLRDQYDVFL